MDTHVWVWSQLEARRLSRRVARVLRDPRNEFCVSPVSTWEIILLCDKGRLQLDGGAEAWVQKVMALMSLREAPLTHEIALATRGIKLPHSDPADRLLAATALIHSLTLVTADRNLAGSKQIPVLWNR